jgi:hypothetical protein
MIPFGANIQGTKRARARLPPRGRQGLQVEKLRGAASFENVSGDETEARRAKRRRLSAGARENGLVLLFSRKDVIRFHGCGELFHA